MTPIIILIIIFAVILFTQQLYGKTMESNDGCMALQPTDTIDVEKMVSLNQQMNDFKQNVPIIIAHWEMFNRELKIIIMAK